MIDAVMGAQLKIEKSHEERTRDIDKTHRRHTRLYMHGMLLISFVKVIMNQYPNLHDLSFIVFFLLMSITMVQNYVEGFYFLTSGIMYSVANTGFLWITWLKRFSGNANYFYFQTVAMNTFLVLMYLQVFIGADGKRKKYAR